MLSVLNPSDKPEGTTVIISSQKADNTIGKQNCESVTYKAESLSDDRKLIPQVSYK